MEINKELILKVAKNSRIKLTDKEIEEFVPQFKEILNSFSELDKINTENVNPSFHPVDIRNALREDKPKDSIPTEELLKNAKHKKGNYFLGPKAL
ncbi:Asp-tRNA(Asn)/Glu-tRNA(Gln) amidotransferase subunit GatC [Candidatus Woesearchaeota archaeon]|nr:Asp-tRNA(Asn)/Glu-tRNA(Gln) amidotransferase subunit GatC [Candidatus Woesearchaeota archaeon]